MTRIVIDDQLRQKLLGLTQPLELCDESGRILGRLIPATDVSDYEPREPSADEQELRRREQSKKWYTTQEVLDHLN